MRGEKKLSIEIEAEVLEKACTEMIETIFLCLPNAFKGTIYRVGRLPGLIVERVTSGVVNDDRKTISWGFPAESGYNPPGRPWLRYRDEPNRPLEAMAWCVENQKSWTAEDPANDARSVALQVHVGLDDFHHLEPVLVRKSDLHMDMYISPEYPRTHKGDLVWKDSEYVVVAVIKIHFAPNTIKINSPETRVIKKLSRSLGTELLSYQLHQDSMKAIQEMARDRLNACNILADSLRNAITKSGLIFSLIKQEIGYIRAEWEQQLLDECGEKGLKYEVIKELDSVLTDIEEVDEDTREHLKNAHARFLNLSLPPGQGERWVEMQIEERWKRLLEGNLQAEEKGRVARDAIEKLKRSLRLGQDPYILARYDKLSEAVKREWVSLIYGNIESFDGPFLERLIKLLDNSTINIPSRERSRKTLIQCKALAETMNQLERNTNFLLHQVLNGNGEEAVFYRGFTTKSR